MYATSHNRILIQVGMAYYPAKDLPAAKKIIDDLAKAKQN